ncbi:hypothetical protein SCLCIDRAFT_506088 [Scleroderma citrinum Foug A]|uniref:Uncharacterized protein n=1 Tax=Scleroderma citrinum Foug A TaxID=1036808 RepID=A0A0C3EQQ5_9AGAM|nr:hypothetical protein SCLCIDRAFT_506088 [Scleroderma citrinum Foug A]
MMGRQQGRIGDTLSSTLSESAFCAHRRRPLGVPMVRRWRVHVEGRGRGPRKPWATSKSWGLWGCRRFWEGSALFFCYPSVHDLEAKCNIGDLRELCPWSRYMVTLVKPSRATNVFKTSNPHPI